MLLALLRWIFPGPFAGLLHAAGLLDFKPVKKALLNLQEVEPGVYSISFGQSGLIGRVSARGIARHAWLDPTVPRLAVYQREPRLVQPAAVPDQAAQQAACAAVSQHASALPFFGVQIPAKKLDNLLKMTLLLYAG